MPIEIKKICTGFGTREQFEIHTVSDIRHNVVTGYTLRWVPYKSVDMKPIRNLNEFNAKACEELKQHWYKIYMVGTTRVLYGPGETTMEHVQWLPMNHVSAMRGDRRLHWAPTSRLKAEKSQRNFVIY